MVFGSRDHLFLAPNYHMTELQAAVGIAQLAKAREMLEARQLAATQLDALLSPLSAKFGLRRVMDVQAPGCISAVFWYVVTLDPLSLKALQSEEAKGGGVTVTDAVAEVYGCVWI